MRRRRDTVRRRRRQRGDGAIVVVVVVVVAAAAETAQGLGDGAKIAIQDLPVRRTLWRGEGEGTKIGGQAIADGDSED